MIIIGSNCQLEDLINPQSVISIKCYEQEKINLFLQEIFELRKQVN